MTALVHNKFAVTRLAKPVARKPCPLQPIQWGKPDKALASGVMLSIAETTPPPAIPFNFVLHRRLREFLRGHGVGQ
jgi:hypothetical protein